MVVLVAVATAAGTAWFVVPRDRSTAVDVGEAIDRFRDNTVPTSDPSPTVPDTTAANPPDTVPAPTTPGTTPLTTPDTAPVTTAPAAVLPEPGVYRYATEGSESIDALGGTRHEYPEISTITVTDDRAVGGCGRHLRWDVLAERYEEWRLCTDGSHVVQQATSLQFHEFFGQKRPEDVVCDLPVRLTDPTADPVQQDCILEDRPWAPRWEHLGTEERTIGTETFVVHHVRMVVDDTDDLPESHVQDWFVRLDGLPVEVVVQKRSVNPNPIGGVVEYLESYRLVLVDPEPIT